MIPILTVSYSDDLPHLVLQAHSLEKFLIQPTEHYIYIEDSLINIEEYEKILKPIYKRNHLVILHDLYNFDANGYFRQQYLKLKISSDLNKEKILILDSKNGFYKPIDLSFWFNDVEGGGGMKYNSINQVDWFDFYLQWIQHVERETRLSCPYLTHPTTPFIFRKETLDRMNSSINLYKMFSNAVEINRKDQSFQLSEFILYQFFMDSKYTQLIVPSELYTIYRNHAIKEEFRTVLIDVGLDKKIVNPAINHTRQ